MNLDNYSIDMLKCLSSCINLYIKNKRNIEEFYSDLCRELNSLNGLGEEDLCIAKVYLLTDPNPILKERIINAQRNMTYLRDYVKHHIDAGFNLRRFYRKFNRIFVNRYVDELASNESFLDRFTAKKLLISGLLNEEEYEVMIQNGIASLRDLILVSLKSLKFDGEPVSSEIINSLQIKRRKYFNLICGIERKNSSQGFVKAL